MERKEWVVGQSNFNNDMLWLVESICEGLPPPFRKIPTFPIQSIHETNLTF
jgi:hypothetical protein